MHKIRHVSCDHVKMQRLHSAPPPPPPLFTIISTDADAVIGVSVITRGCLGIPETLSIATSKRSLRVILTHYCWIQA